MEAKNPWQDVKDAVGIGKVHIPDVKMEIFKTSKDTKPLGVIKYNGPAELLQVTLPM